MSNLAYKKHERISLKGHSEFNEKWLQHRIAVQINALLVDERVIVDFVRVLDQRLLRRDDVAPTLPAVDRSYWTQRSSGPVIQIADEVLDIINEKADPKQRLNYNRHYIGLT